VDVVESMVYVLMRFYRMKFLELTQDLVTRWLDGRHHLNFHGDVMGIKMASISMILCPLKKEILRPQSGAISRLVFLYSFIHFVIAFQNSSN
jgi:hypothetical protein